MRAAIRCTNAPNKELEPNDDSRSAIRATLESEVGDVLGGKRGSKILASIRAHFETKFTVTGRPTGEYARAMRGTEALETDLADVRNKLSSYEEKVTELEGKLDRLSRYNSGQTLEKAQTTLQSAQEANRKIEHLEKERSKRISNQRVAEAESETASVAWKKRQEDIRGLDAATGSCAPSPC